MNQKIVKLTTQINMVYTDWGPISQFCQRWFPIAALLGPASFLIALQKSQKSTMSVPSITDVRYHRTLQMSDITEHYRWWLTWRRLLSTSCGWAPCTLTRTPRTASSEHGSLTIRHMTIIYLPKLLSWELKAATQNIYSCVIILELIIKLHNLITYLLKPMS